MNITFIGLVARMMQGMRNVCVVLALFCGCYFIREAAYTVYYLFILEAERIRVHLIFSLGAFWFFIWIAIVAHNIKEFHLER